jgi:hypothetical protein
MKNRQAKSQSIIRRASASPKNLRARHEFAFREIVALIREARQKVFRSVNVDLINLYWGIGERISERITSDGWGKSTIASLAA